MNLTVVSVQAGNVDIYHGTLNADFWTEMLYYMWKKRLIKLLVPKEHYISRGIFYDLHGRFKNCELPVYINLSMLFLPL